MPDVGARIDQAGMDVANMLKSPGWKVLQRELERYTDYVTGKVMSGVGAVEYNNLIAGHAAVTGFLKRVEGIAGSFEARIREDQVRSQFPDDAFRGGR